MKGPGPESAAAAAAAAAAATAAGVVVRSARLQVHLRFDEEPLHVDGAEVAHRVRRPQQLLRRHLRRRHQNFKGTFERRDGAWPSFGSPDGSNESRCPSTTERAIKR